MVATEQSINQILQAAFSILTYEKVGGFPAIPKHSTIIILQVNQPHLLGASIFSPEDIYDNLKTLKKKLLGTATGPL